ncbi:S41 family peptidase [Lysobacter sp. K5869]|uniref:S41 family peptidase n=1 Tax=Lysobacter sp. K5869 TaxID=2820808 RepID=UPI001C063836|nr:S41 family peptidase [Lysobacter sp. K5869]QWP77973.1 S41 family peptidase [Lysobacter sp. K5869]
MKPVFSAPRRCALAAAALLAAAPVFAAPPTLPPVPESALHPVVANGAIAAGARGIWAVPGYGDIYALSASGASMYQYADGLCWRVPADSDTILDKVVRYYARSPRPRDFIIASSPQATQLHAVELPRLPAACTAPLDRSKPLYTFDAVSLTLKRLYAYNQERHLDWNARIARLRPSAARARSDAELKPVMAELLRGVDDLHTALLGEIDGRGFEIQSQRGAHFTRLRQRYDQLPPQPESFLDWMQTWIAQERVQADAQLLPGTRGSALDGRVVWGRLPGNVGYLAVTAMAGYGGSEEAQRAAAGQAVDEALSHLQGTRALVFDIAHNLGGLDLVSAEIASRFADRERLAYRKHPYPDPRVQPQPLRIAPGGTSRYLKPVYLLTSEFTCSAGETFTLMMRALPQVVQVGQPTQGIFSDGLAKFLPNGWSFSLSNEVYRDAWGESYEARGLPPDLAAAVYPAKESAGSYGRALRRTAQWAAGR